MSKRKSKGKKEYGNDVEIEKKVTEKKEERR